MKRVGKLIVGRLIFEARRSYDFAGPQRGVHPAVGVQYEAVAVELGSGEILVIGATACDGYLSETHKSLKRSTAMIVGLAGSEEDAVKIAVERSQPIMIDALTLICADAGAVFNEAFVSTHKRAIVPTGVFVG